MSMLRTAIASAAMAIASYAAAQWLTHDFQVWTAEGERRLAVALHPVPAPPVGMVGVGLQGETLEALLAQGAPTIVDFMYTRCVSVCSALGSMFQQMQAAIAADDAAPGTVPLHLLSISFDPAHDDPKVLAAYAARLHADPRIWRFASAATASDMRRLLDRYQVTVIPDGLGGYEHNAALLVVDGGGRLVRVFDYTELDMALAYAHSLPVAGPRP